MAAGYWKFRADQGATWAVVLTVKDVSGPVDLTGYLARMQLREHVGSPVTLLDLASPATMQIDGPAGVIAWEVAATVTAAWTWRHAVHDLEIVAPSGRVTRLLAGEVVVSPEVTR